MNQVMDKVAQSVVCKENIIGFLKLMADNINMSPMNLAMIYLQRQDAKMVCGRKAWKKMGYEVKENAIPIVIYVPLITEESEGVEFTEDGQAQVLKDNPDVVIMESLPVFAKEFVPQNAFSLSDIEGEVDETPVMEEGFMDSIIEITGATQEIVPQAAINGMIEKGMYDREENIFYFSDEIDISTEYGRELFNKTALGLYASYVFENYDIENKSLFYAVLYVIYEYFYISHEIESPLFFGLDKLGLDEKAEFIVTVNFIATEIIMDMEGYALSFDETAFVNDLFESEEPEELWTAFDKVVHTLEDKLLKDEIEALKRKLMRVDPSKLGELYEMKVKKELYSIPPVKLPLDNKDYLREARQRILAGLEY